jgi:hypothetical protein
MFCSVPEALRHLYKMFKSKIRLINLSSYLGRCLIKIGMVTAAYQPPYPLTLRTILVS